MKTFRLLSALLLTACLMPLAASEPPSVLKAEISAPPTGRLDAGITAVAIDSVYTVLGAPHAGVADEIHGSETDLGSGIVNIYNTVTGSLHLRLTDPNPDETRVAFGGAVYSRFGTEVAVSGSRVVVTKGTPLVAYVYDLTQPNPEQPIARFAAPDNSWGLHVAISGDLLVVAAPKLVIQSPGVSYLDPGSDVGTVKVYDLSSTSPQVAIATYQDPNQNLVGAFGSSIAISGNRIVVGSQMLSLGNGGVARVYENVYVYDAAQPNIGTPATVIPNPAPSLPHYFGMSVGTSGNLVAVGSHGSGVRVYDLAATEPETPVFAVNQSSPFFGNSVAFSGTTLATSGQSNPSGIATYDLSDPLASVPTQILSVQDFPVGFGSAISVHGTKVLVSALRKAYSFDLAGAQPTIPTTIFNSVAPSARDQFSRSIAIQGNKMAVGTQTHIVPEWLLPEELYTNTRAYIYDSSSANPAVPILTLESPLRDGVPRRGLSSVAMNANGIVAVGDHASNTFGSVYLYNVNSTTPTVPEITIDNPNSVNDLFGYPVALSSRFLAVGAPFRNPSGENSGAVYIFDITSAPPNTPAFVINYPNPTSGGIGQVFGSVIAIDGSRLVIGADYNDSGAVDSGVVYVYDLAGATPTSPALTLSNPKPKAEDHFGGAVAIKGSFVVVGAPDKDSGGADTGKVYVYDLGSRTPSVPIISLSNPAPSPGDRFGAAVAVSGSLVSVGAPHDDTAAPEAGTVYVFDIDGDHPSAPVSIIENPSNKAAGDHFGATLALDGEFVAIGAPDDSKQSLSKGAAYVFGAPPDTVTTEPTLNAPLSNSTVGSPMYVSFNLPEAALPGSVKLTFDGPTSVAITLAASHETRGQHQFVFPLANPQSVPDIATGSAIADGVYSVRLSYQDAVGNAVAQSAVSTGVVVNTSALIVGGVFAPLRIVAGSPLPDYAAQAIAMNATGAATFSQTPAPGTVPITGTVSVEVRVVDGSNMASVFLDVIVVPAAEPGGKGAVVPGAGLSDSGIPAGAVWDSFGVPSINDAGQCVVLCTYKSGTAKTTSILTFNVLDMGGTMKVIATKGGAAGGIPRAVYSSFGEPLLGPDGSVAFSATLANAPETTDSVVTADNQALFLDADGGGDDSPIMIVRKGHVTTGETVLKTLTSVGLGSNAVTFTATLATGIGGVTAASDSGLWVYNRTNSTLSLALREGDALQGATVKTINALVARPNSPGQGRGTVYNGGEDITCVRVTLSDTRQAVGFIGQDGTGAFNYFTLGDAVGYGNGGKWQSFGLPTQNSVSSAMVFLGTVKAATGNATSSNNVAIFAEDDAEYGASRVVSKGDPAGGVTGGIFSAFKDPVSASNRGVAFIATLKSDTASGISAANNDGIWRSDDTDGLRIVAREGAQATEAPVGAKWKAFSSLAMPDGRGPIFLATLAGGGVTSANDLGLWATDSSGALRLLLREGDAIGVSTVKSIVVLSSVLGSPSQTRSFNNHGSVVVKAIDALGAQHLIHLTVP